MKTAMPDQLIQTLRDRFEKNQGRHAGIVWGAVQSRLEAHPEKLAVLQEMERTGGEPDVISYDQSSGETTFCDCSAESPVGRRSLCYDHKALESRKENRPVDSAITMASTMGIEMLSEEQYRALQTLGQFDLKTSSWVLTPASIRKLGGAVFCDRRYDHVFMYHNGADSYYAARGFRGLLKV